MGGCQNNSTIGTSPDPLSAREGLACETNLRMPREGGTVFCAYALTELSHYIIYVIHIPPPVYRILAVCT